MTMNRQQRKALERIDEKIAKAKASNNLFKVMQLTQERKKLLEPQIVEQRLTLREALSNYTQEERNQATSEVIYAVATADLLYSATMTVEETLRKKFGIGLPMLDEMRDIVKRLSKLVATIDKVGNEMFSYSYADIVTEVETKYEATMLNYIHNKIIKYTNDKMR